MAKKISFNDLPSAVEKILEILMAEGSDHTALPELVQRVAVMEKRLDKIEQILSPDRPVMDQHTTMRVLKIRPKILHDMENSGILLSHTEGRRKFFYEDDVIRCFINQSLWKNALEEAAKPAPVELIASEIANSEQTDTVSNEPDTINEVRLVNIDVAAELLGKKKLTIYKLTSRNKIPFIRKGNKLYFEVEKLEQWKTENSSRRRKPTDDKSVKNEVSQDFVDIYGASKILDRTPSAIHQHLSSLTYRKVGNRLYFDRKQLEEWAKNHPPRKRKSKSNETESA